MQTWMRVQRLQFVFLLLIWFLRVWTSTSWSALMVSAADLPSSSVQDGGPKQTQCCSLLCCHGNSSCCETKHDGGRWSHTDQRAELAEWSHGCCVISRAHCYQLRLQTPTHSYESVFPFYYLCYFVSSQTFEGFTTSRRIFKAAEHWTRDSSFGFNYISFVEGFLPLRSMNWKHWNYSEEQIFSIIWSNLENHRVFSLQPSRFPSNPGLWSSDNKDYGYQFTTYQRFIS